jgi:predicted short-subunit dehydrogenase-like oxidoreductase (DUF2520 family)
MRVYILGAGKVGSSLARALRKAGCQVTLRPARRGLPSRTIQADLLVLAVRDRELAGTAEALARKHLVGQRTACVHVAGALGADVLAPLRAVSAGVGQMHPMISFASRRKSPSLVRGNVHIQGDRPAVERARAVARRLRMSPRTFVGLDSVAYHAAAGLVANGAAALAAVGGEVLSRAGVPKELVAKMLGPLLRSVAENIEELGFPDSLTGPVRRGDAGAVAKHLKALRDRGPAAVDLYRAAALAQLPLARAISDAPPGSLDEIADLLRTPDRPADT